MHDRQSEGHGRQSAGCHHPRVLHDRRLCFSAAAGREWSVRERHHSVREHQGPCRRDAGAARAATRRRHLRADRDADDDRVGRPDEGDRAMSEEFIGSGWAFPLRTDPTGRIALVSREREIEESIRLILGTAIGERPMRPEFGCGIHDYVFAPADSETANKIAAEVRASLRRWEPRIRVRDVAVSFDEADTSTLYIDIRYALGNTNDPRNLVFPFYVIPQEGKKEQTESKEGE